MKLSEFSYNLPPELIAQYPSENRDECRLMVLNRATKTIEHKKFKDLLEYFDEDDVLVVNDSMVFPARLYGNKEKTGAKIEVFLLRKLTNEGHLWDVLVDPARKIRVGNKLYFGDGELVAEVIDNTTSRGRTIRFLFDGTPDDFMKAIDELGETPLPKYIKRKVEPEDRDRFQTIFADKLGSVAAPSAGMHFTKQLVKRLELKGAHLEKTTLYVGLGSFRAVDVEDLTKHKMDSEQFIIPEKTAETVNFALDNKKRVCAVGSTVLRSLESSVSAGNRVKPTNLWTDKFMFPPYDFKICNSFITNFHQPESTLMMMASAFGGFEFVKHAYQVAIEEKYSLLTYGDAMLII
ncbi:MAG: tRNA preQ1(34) S-adenosylmethionine ribosyltransferase-isomerase QueA [Bacteroidetes bacterium]|nr:MAG: tRNA preQ1(34) S-adenosylmethionine ribosyltransferase-isomerase QueA [Bacteroidota bacterium]